MPFNHYAKIKKILNAQGDGWVIKRIDEPTTAQNFKGEVLRYDYYYRIYSAEGQPIKFCKFQKIDLLAKTLSVSVEDLPIVNN